VFTHEHEKVLAGLLSKFPEMLETVTNDLKLNLLCQYIFNLAELISTGYKQYKCLDNEHMLTRVQLFEAVRVVM